MARGDFSKKDVINRLLWCNRHCCLCGKSCGPHIQMAHLIKRCKPDSGDIDNGSPLCLECHAIIGAYDPDHAMGKQFDIEELKKRREQIYEEHTRHLVPPIDFRMTQQIPNRPPRSLPDIGFYIGHVGDSLPVQVLVSLQLWLGDKKLEVPEDSYTGRSRWNLNPRMHHWGHFTRNELQGDTEGLRAVVMITVIDQYERYHELLPVAWNYKSKYGDWVSDLRISQEEGL